MLAVQYWSTLKLLENRPMSQMEVVELYNVYSMYIYSKYSACIQIFALKMSPAWAGRFVNPKQPRLLICFYSIVMAVIDYPCYPWSIWF